MGVAAPGLLVLEVKGRSANWNPMAVCEGTQVYCFHPNAVVSICIKG